MFFHMYLLDRLVDAGEMIFGGQNSNNNNDFAEWDNIIVAAGEWMKKRQEFLYPILVAGRERRHDKKMHLSRKQKENDLWHDVYKIIATSTRGY